MRDLAASKPAHRKARRTPRIAAIPELVFRQSAKGLAPVLVGAAAFMILFWEPIFTLGRDWWTEPAAGHGLLLGPLAIILAWSWWRPLSRWRWC